MTVTTENPNANETKYSKHVRPIVGPQSQSRDRNLILDAIGTVESVEWPSGADITSLQFHATLDTNATTIQAPDASDNSVITTIDLTHVTGICFESTVGTVTTEYSVDGTNFTAVDGRFTSPIAAATAVTDADRGNLVRAVTVVNQMVTLDTTNIKAIRFKNGAAAQSTLRYSITSVSDSAFTAITVDAANDVLAAAFLTIAQATNTDIQWKPIPIGKLIDMDLTTILKQGSLSGGTLHAKSVGGVPVNLWIGAS